MCQRERLIFRAVRRDTARARFPIMAKHQVLGACSGLLHRVPSFDSCVENKIIGQRTDGDQNFKYLWVGLGFVLHWELITTICQPTDQRWSNFPINTKGAQ